MLKSFFISLCTVAVLLFFWLLEYRGESPSANGGGVVETFDLPELSELGQAIQQHTYTHLAYKAGTDGSRAIRVSYEGFERGSRRVVLSPRVELSEHYELSFWVQFCDGFDFARGGKLHGLGPAKPVTGGNSITPEGWSARLMFRGGGGLQTYIYHQNMAGRFGDTQRANDFVFEPGRYYQVRMQVALNTPATASNGSVKVWVDDQRLIEHTGLRFRDRESESSQIQRFLFSTFHGGSSPEWAPRNSDGSYKTDCAYFDTIALTPSP